MEVRSGEDGLGPDDFVEGLSGAKLLEGRYRLLRRIAAGGMASVYVAEHTLIGRQVAIKILHQQYAEDAECVRRFLDEGRTVGTLGHPHIVESTDMGRTETGAPFLVLELLEGRTLEHEIRYQGRLPIRRSLRIAQQIASALEAAHSRGVIHRDLKSGNVFLVNRTDGDHAKVLDFGISKFMEGKGHTQKGKLLGTPWYMAPEQINDPGSVDARCDVYSLGVILYEMLTGQVPFADTQFPLIFTKILQEEPRPIRSLCPDVGPDLAALVSSALTKSPGRRIPSMHEFGRGLARIVGPYWLEMRARARSQSDFEVARTLRATGTPMPEFDSGLGRMDVTTPVAVAPPHVAGPPQPSTPPPHLITPPHLATPPQQPIAPIAPPRQVITPQGAVPVPGLGPTTPAVGPMPVVEPDQPLKARVISRRQTASRPHGQALRRLAVWLVAAAVAAAVIFAVAQMVPVSDRRETAAPVPAPAADVAATAAPPAAAMPEAAATGAATAEAATETPASEATKTEAPATEAAAAEVAPPAPSTARLTVRSSARGAVAHFRGETYRLPMRAVLSRGDQPETVEVSAPGRVPRTISVLLSRDRRLIVELERVPRASRASGTRATAESGTSAGATVVGPAGHADPASDTTAEVPTVADPRATPPTESMPKAPAPRPAVKADGPAAVDAATLQRRWYARAHQAVERKKHEALTCHERGRMDNPQLSGRVVVKIYVEPTGKVMQARIASSSLHNRRVEACIEQAVESWTLPAPPAGVSSFTWPVNLQ